MTDVWIDELEEIETGYAKFYADGTVEEGRETITQHKGKLFRDMGDLASSLKTPTHMYINPEWLKRMRAMK